MTRKKYIYLAIVMGISIFISYFFISDIREWAVITNVFLASFLIYTSYLLFYKKSYNLLAGMTEEELKKSESDIEIRLKYEKGAKIMGVISFIKGFSQLRRRSLRNKKPPAMRVRDKS